MWIEMKISGLNTDEYVMGLQGDGFRFGPDFGLHSEGTRLVLRSEAAHASALRIADGIAARRRAYAA